MIGKKKYNSQTLTRIVAKLHFNSLFPSLAAGSVAGLLEITLTLSFATLIYTGELSEFLGVGIGLALLGVIIAGLTISFFTSLPGIVGGNQDVSTAVLAVISVTIMHNMPAGSTSLETFLTVVAAIVLTSLLTGGFLWLLGHFRLGRFVRFLPYPVVGGFLAGTGWLLATGAISTMTNSPISVETIPHLMQSEMLLRWLPGVLFAVVILLLGYRTDHFLVLPLMILGGMTLFYLIAGSNGLKVEDLSASGWLVGPFPEGNLLPSIALSDLSLVNWPLVGGQVVNIATILIVSVLALLLNASGVEVVAKEDVDLNQELRAAGAGNFIAGWFGGMVSFQQLGLSAMNIKMKARSRLAGLITVVVCGLALFLGASILSLFPRLILAGLVLFLGLSFLDDWLVKTWSNLPKLDYFIILLILVVTAVIGFIEAVGVGLLMAVILFVMNYSRIDVVRHEMSGINRQSRVSRPHYQQHYLRQHGEQIHILQLQGYIFFGTADNLLNQVRMRLEQQDLPPVQSVVLDFSKVTKIDSTAMFSFKKMQQLTHNQNSMLILTDLSREILRYFNQVGLSTKENVRLFTDLDRGLEACEDDMLANIENDEDNERPLWQEMKTSLSNKQQNKHLFDYLERLDVEVGDYLIRQGEPSDDLYFIDSGQVTAQLEGPGRSSIRLQTMRSGFIVGEIGFYLGQKRTAAVVVDEPGIIYRLSSSALKKMQIENPEIAAEFHKFMSHFMAERVTHLADQVNAFQQYK